MGRKRYDDNIKRLVIKYYNTHKEKIHVDRDILELFERDPHL